MEQSVQMLPCKCGGLPFVALHFDEQYDETLYFVKCMECQNVSSPMETDSFRAVIQWNTANKISQKGGICG